MIPNPNRPLASKEIANWQGYMTEGEVEALKDIVRQLPENAIVVKIGAGAGTDTIAMLEERQDITIFSIDINCCNDPVATNEHIRLTELDWYDDQVIRIWGDSKKVLKYWPPEWRINLLHIDGDHSAEGLIGDMKWIPLVVDGGWVTIHDYQSWAWGAVTETVDKSGLTKYGQKDTLFIHRKE